VTSKFVSPRRFHELARRGDADGAAVARFGAVARQADVGSRTKRFVFSDESVDRMGDSIRAAGWQYRDFMRNPVCLWSHNNTAPPIGKVTNVFVSGGKLIGDIRFATAETYKFADDVFRLIDAGYISAVSVGFSPIEWEISKSPGRRGGVDFLKQELLEISVVSLPANANALLEGKMLAGRRAADDPVAELGALLGRMIRTERLRRALEPRTPEERAERTRELKYAIWRDTPVGRSARTAALRRELK
jgi:HK97 family phage prohead protease